MDVTKSMLPKSVTFVDMAKELMGKYEFDSNQVLASLLGAAFYNMRYGNKREERAACELLNEFQDICLKHGKLKEQPTTPACHV